MKNILFEKYFNKKNWEYTAHTHEHSVQYKIEFNDATGSVTFYTTGSILVQGPENNIRRTLLKMKNKVDEVSNGN